MGWDVRLGDLDQVDFNRVLQHPEQAANLSVVTGLLAAFDAAGQDPRALQDLQADLFRFSYRAQLAAQGLGRALSRVKGGKAAGWPLALDGEMARFVSPPWRTVCEPDSAGEEEWRRERVVAERVIRQLRAVGDALAWRVHRYDRRVIIALSRNGAAGPFVGKAGLDSELGRVTELQRERGHFALLHDLTSVLRVLDVTEVEAGGRRMLHEVKSSDSPSATHKARKQIRRAERLLAAVDGSAPLPGEEESSLWRARTQMRTHAAEIRGLLEQAQGSGHAVARIADRVVGVIDLLAAASTGDAEAQLDAYTRRRGRLLDRRLGLDRGLHQLRAVSADTAARDPASVPWAIYPLSARHRAALICDYLILDAFMSGDELAARMCRHGLQAEVVLPIPGGPLDSSTPVIAVTDQRRQRRLVLHGSVVYQLLLEGVRTDRFVQASLELLALPDPTPRPVLTYSNERACWR